MIRRHAKSILCAAAATVLSFGLAAGGARPQTRPRLAGQTSAVRLRATLAVHKKNITDIYFSPDGETLATVGQDGTILLWNVGTGATKATLRIADKYRLTGLLWSPDGLRLAAYANRGWSGVAEVRVWDARTGELKVTFEPNHASYMTDFEWSPDGRLLMTASDDGTVKLWDAETGRLGQSLGQDPREPDETDSLLKSIFTRKKFAEIRHTNGYFDAAGQTVLTLSMGSSPKLWDVASGKLKTTLPLSEEKPDAKYPYYPTTALLTPDRRLVIRNDDAGVALLDTATGQVKRSLGHTGSPLAFSPDGRTLLVVVRDPKFRWRGGGEDTLRLYDVETGQVRLTFENVPEGVQDIYWSPDGSHIVAAGWAKTSPRVLDAHTGRVTGRLPYSGCTSDSWWDTGCEGFRFSADGRVVFKQKNPLKLWSTENGQLLAQLEDVASRAVFSPTDKHLLVTRGQDKRTALLWEVSVR